MTRVRISTTVDGQTLAACRQLLGQSDSKLVDRALVALLHDLEARHELAALDAQPYEEDPDLAWEAAPAPSALGRVLRRHGQGDGLLTIGGGSGRRAMGDRAGRAGG